MSFAEQALVKAHAGYASIYVARGLCEAGDRFGTRKTSGELAQGDYHCLVRQAQREYAALGYTYINNLQEYTPFGNWLYFSRTFLPPRVPGTESWSPDELSFDADQTPRTSYRGKLVYNPVTIALYALSMHGRFVQGQVSARDGFLHAANHLISMQDALGALRFPFAWHYYFAAKDYAPGWCSAMAQGLALSVFARAYHITGDRRYIQAGDKALAFLLVPVSQGGVRGSLANVDPALGKAVIFEEYPANPSAHTLNGFMYTILGLYDWSSVPGQDAEQAHQYFDTSLNTLRSILPYYDLGGFTAYDLSHLIRKSPPHVGVSYHGVHVFLLHALVSITADEQLKYFETRWASYVPR